MIMNVKRPFASYIAAPFGLGPHGSTLLPSGFTSWAETNIQVPTSWSLIDFCWAATLLGNKAAANTIGTDLTQQTRLGALQILELAAPGHVVAGWELDLAGHRFLCVPPRSRRRRGRRSCSVSYCNGRQF